MQKNTDYSYSTIPTAEYPYFTFDSSDGVFYYFKTLNEATLYADNIKSSFLDDVWDEDVEGIMVGRVHGLMCKHNVVERPDDDKLDESGYCKKTGKHWLPEWSYICDYKIKPLGAKPSKSEAKEALKP